MDTNLLLKDDSIRQQRNRIIIILLMVSAVTTGHWWTPRSEHLLIAHVILRKLYFLPVVTAAIWFNLRGSILTAMLVTFLYSLHVIFQWRGATFENINQIGEIATIWVLAISSGIFVRIEKDAFRDVARTHEGSLLALVAALDAREHDTELHSLRVRAYALRLGRELGLDQNKMQILGQASLLHDVGKIGTPDGILLKPGPLDDDEWKIMRQHPETGRRLLLSVPFLKDAAEIVYSHHERYDGSGYPRGHSGEQIPFGARIFAVADVFDALSSDRPYRKKMSYEEVKEKIKKESGAHFDPKVVEAFMQVSASEWDEIEKRISARAAHLTGQNYNLLENAG